MRTTTNDNNSALRIRPVEAERSLAAAPSKRRRQHEASRPIDGDTMDVDVTTTTTTTSIPYYRSNVGNSDETLIQMVQSGQYSHDQVVQFCIQSGIPLSRMLRLDLMRLTVSTNDNSTQAAPKR